jgi:hypothetical protein
MARTAYSLELFQKSIFAPGPRKVQEDRYLADAGKNGNIRRNRPAFSRHDLWVMAPSALTFSTASATMSPMTELLCAEIAATCPFSRLLIIEQTEGAPDDGIY